MLHFNPKCMQIVFFTVQQYSRVYFFFLISLNRSSQTTKLLNFVDECLLAVVEWKAVD